MGNVNVRLNIEAGFGALRPILKAVARIGTMTFFAPVLGALMFVGPATAQIPLPEPKYPDLPSEIPAKFEPVTDSFDYVRREVMIPMRDGVKLHTVILVPKGARALRSC